MDITPAIKNFLYYFKATRNPIIWVLGIAEPYARTIAQKIYLGSNDWFDSNIQIVDVLRSKDIDVKDMSVDVMLVDMTIVAPSGVGLFLDKAKVVVSKNGDLDEIKTFFKSRGLTLVEEIGTELTWVHSGSRRG